MSTILLLAALLSFSFAFVLVPVVRHLFRQWGFVDKPDRERKLHATAVSLGGGLAVFLAVGLSMAAILSLYAPAAELAPAALRGTLFAVFVASTILLGVGLIDDLYGLHGVHKLVAQFLVATMVVASGTVVQRVGLLGVELDLGVFAAPLTVVWLLAAINAINLIDGADGMAATASGMIAASIAIVAVFTASLGGGLLAATVAGAVVGFLVYNRPPASIYLGDAGSMVIGLILGVSSLWVTVVDQTLTTLVPLALLSLPIFDAAIAFLRRTLTGRSIYSPDRGHLHHRLLDRFSHPAMLVVVAAITLGTGTMSILSVALGQPWIAVCGTILVLGCLVVSDTFGKAELRMLLLKTPNPVNQVNRRRDCSSCAEIKQHTVHLQGVREWDNLWKSLAEFACDRQLIQLKLDICIAWREEGFHGVWSRPRKGDKRANSVLKLPVYVDGRLVGRMDAICDSQSDTYFGTMQLLIEKTEELGTQIRHLLDGPTPTAAPSPTRVPVAVVDPNVQEPELTVATTRA